MASNTARRLQAVDNLEPMRDGRRIVRVGLTLIVLFFGVFGVWAAVAPLSGAVIVPGTIKIADYRKTVQHLEGGIVKEILVKDGDTVRRGQPLIVLDDVRARAAVESLQIQLDAFLARAARLQAERQRQASVVFPPELQARRDDSRVTSVLEAELAFFESRRQFVESQASLLRAQNEEALAEIKGLSAQIKAADQYIEYTREQLEMTRNLHEKNFVAYTGVLDMRRQLVQKEEQRGEYVANLSQAKQRIAERELRIVSLYEGYTRDATNELKDVESRISDLRERLRPFDDQLKRQTLSAPIEGVVVGLKVHTRGAVIAPGESVMDVVPADAPVIAEGKLRIEDIDEVRVGSPVDVQLSAYHRRTTPKVDGKVIYLSADALTESASPEAIAYYLVRIEIDRSSLATIGDLALTPGMPVEAFIRTRERTMLDYLLEPVTNTLRRALREG